MSLRKGHHEALISFETYQKIQERIKEGARVPARKDINQDFPLRGFIMCGDCGKPLTANWSTSKTGKKHPYYLCFNKACQSHRKSVRRDEVEGAFATLLKQMRPSASMFMAVKGMFKNAWEQRLIQADAILSSLKHETQKVEKQIEQLVDRIVDSESTTAVTAYERRIIKLERNKLVLAEKIEKGIGPVRPFEEMFELAFKFLSSPWNLWASDRLEDKRAVLKLAFTENLAYHRKDGFRTPEISIPFKLLGDKNMLKCDMAEGVGFEPTRRLHACRFSRPVPSTTRPPLQHKTHEAYQQICPCATDINHFIYI